MIHILLKLLGLRGINTLDVLRYSFELRGFNNLVWLLPIAAIAGYLIWRTYKNAAPELSQPRRILLGSLRAAFIALLFILILRPTLQLTIARAARRTVAFLFDTSASMSIPDQRTDHDDSMRVALARDWIDPTKGLDQPFRAVASADITARNDLLKAVLSNPRLDLTNKLSRDYNLRAYTFDSQVNEIPSQDPRAWPEHLTATGPATAIGDAIRETLNRSRGQPLAAIVLATDGASNTGSSTLAAADIARASNVPLYIYGVGVSGLKDIVVSSLFAPDVTFVNDSVLVTIRLHSQKLQGRSSTLNLKLNDKIVATRDILFDSDAEQVISMSFTPDQKGDFILAASVDPLPDEAVKDNNSASQRFRVIDEKIKVLYVEQSPRWEFRYLLPTLLRDRRLSVKCVLQEADPSISRVADSPYLPTFPQDKADLLQYDLIILGDIDISTLSSTQIETTSEFVSHFGGGLLLLPGKHFSLQSYIKTPLEKLLPLEPLPNADQSPATQETPLLPTPAGYENPILQFSDDPNQNRELWQSLPGIYWSIPSQRPRPGATVLATTEKSPVIAVQPFGLGQVLLIGTDNTWRWRKNEGEALYTRFWGQAVQHLALPHLLGQSKRTQLSTDRKTYTSGQRINLFARLYTPDFRPVTTDAVTGSYAVGNNSPVKVELHPLPDQPGIYSASFPAGEKGQYQFQVETDPQTQLQFSVEEPRQEFQETAMNEPLLRQLASSSGGYFFREEDLHTLPEKIASRTERIRTNLDLDLWSSPLYFLLILTIVSSEWILRKMSGLK